MELLKSALSEAFMNTCIGPLLILVVIGFIYLLVSIFGSMGPKEDGKSDPPYYGS